MIPVTERLIGKVKSLYLRSLLKPILKIIVKRLLKDAKILSNKSSQSIKMRPVLLS